MRIRLVNHLGKGRADELIAALTGIVFRVPCAEMVRDIGTCRHPRQRDAVVLLTELLGSRDEAARFSDVFAGRYIGSTQEVARDLMERDRRLALEHLREQRRARRLADNADGSAGTQITAQGPASDQAAAHGRRLGA